MTLIIGHRGAPNLAPENTIHSFHKALDCGAHGFEFDIQLSQDDVPVIIHDFNLQRTTEGKGAVQKQNLQKLQQLNAGYRHPQGSERDYIPSLLDVLTEFYPKKPWVNIELKFSPRIEQERIRSAITQIISIIEDFSQWNEIIISSFHWNFLLLCNKLAPKLKLGILLNTRRHIFQATNLADNRKFFSIHPHYKLALPNSLITKLTGSSPADAKILPWTVNSHQTLKNLHLNQYAPWGIITDYPEQFTNKQNN